MRVDPRLTAAVDARRALAVVRAIDPTTEAGRLAYAIAAHEYSLVSQRANRTRRWIEAVYGTPLFIEVETIYAAALKGV